MATQYLSKTGLTYLWGRIVALYQPKEAGKGLSTNDLTDELKAQIEKVSTIETQVTNLVNEGGEPNVIETVKVNGTALTVTDKAVDVDAITGINANGTAVIAPGGVADLFFPNLTGARKTDSGSGDTVVDYIDLKTIDGVGSTDKQIRFTNTATGLSISGEDTSITFSKVIPDETRVNALIAAALAEGIGGVTQFRYLPVDALPATGEAGVIYLVPNSGSAPNIKDEYIWINKGTAESPDYAFELLGTTELDLSGYLQTTDVEAITTAEIDEITGA